MIDEHDIDMVGHDMLPEDAAVGEDHAVAPDPNSLGAILSEAIADVESPVGARLTCCEVLSAKEHLSNCPPSNPRRKPGKFGVTRRHMPSRTACWE
jgi:hypothetical protein